MAVKKAVRRVLVKSSNEFYASKDKFQRAQKLVAEGKFKKVRDAYDILGGKFSEGHGYAPVE